ncbi:MAG: type II toxin-antitoxin system VapC family toxin [Deltaproteobacteria bacterium]|nr:type II toxin-antitoxin system VapC family toxin [Deltaproteobacteria bacterium]
MRTLLDTCVISEFWRPSPSEGVVSWLGGMAPEDLFISVLTLGEIQRGIAKLPAGKKSRELAGLLDELRERFEENTLDVTAEIALRWSDLSGEATWKGRALHPIDGLLCATALAHGLTVAARNETGFGPTGVKLVNPWA